MYVESSMEIHPFIFPMIRKDMIFFLDSFEYLLNMFLKKMKEKKTEKTWEHALHAATAREGVDHSRYALLARCTRDMPHLI